MAKTAPRSDDPLSQLEWLTGEGRSLLATLEEAGDAATKAGVTPDITGVPLSPWQRELIRQQQQLRHRARYRFPEPQRWIWTERSLAQASDWWCASWKAKSLPAAIRVVDACCGAGADAVALSQRQEVIGVDVDPCMTLLTGSNVAAHGGGLETRTEDITAHKLRRLASEAAWLHIDPDRRPADRRTQRAAEFSPPLAVVLEAAQAFAGAIVKMAPVTYLPDELEEAVALLGQRVWLGNLGECRQQLLLLGDARNAPPGTRTAVLAEPPQTGDPQSGPPPADSTMLYAARPGTPPACTLQPDKYVYDLHAVLHAAGLQNSWGAAHGLRPLGDEHGYFTGDVRLDSPWAQRFETRAVLPWDDRQVRRWLRSEGAGIVEVKNRLFRLEANTYQRKYSGTGEVPFTLLVTRLGDRIRVIMAQRS